MGKRVLVVDDSTSTRKVEAFVLHEAGYEVVEAVDGNDALTKLSSTQVDLILTDLNMPEMDGIALIRAVRGGANHRLTPIIMITTESGDASKQQGKTAGATGWIVKPFKPEQLVAVLKRVMG